ncbi:hypothetical protein I302_108066 [Kwoniella bestiolae CBS 10118]|uniref:Uncharacterized protein n=1 Tax=Kwoniella bestiolae CBS 10118 TaxID=1296100 RepID=A0A1B9FWR5_9TREE|nr:hypothetical protein I302_07568 [Kwoniella bestiolae CBS 10118]OCF23214.1 hypothetical protein I302_07568 [Kwoniella bestiolae CBS 10118]
MRTDSESGRADVMIKYIPNPYHQTFGRTVSCEDVLSDEHCDDTNNWASSEILNEVGYHGISGQTLRFIKDPQTPNKYLVVTVPNEYPDHPSEPERYFSMDRRMAEQIEVVDDDAEGWTRGTIGLLGDFKSAIT